jgi:hypothetical protein
MKLRSILPLLAFLAVLATGVACSDSTGVAPATIPNTIDTITLAAALDTNLAVPSGYSVSAGRAVRTENSSDFDFVYNLNGAKRPVFLTTQVLGVLSTTSIHPGFQGSPVPFDEMTTAPINNYNSIDSIFPDSGDVYYVRSALVCSTLSSPIYGKLEVLSIDSAAQTITIRTLIDLNCGYHGLTVGTPSH